MEDQVTTETIASNVPTETVMPVDAAPAPVRIDIANQQIRTSKVVLVAEDFAPGTPSYVGLALTCRTDFPMNVRKKLIGLVLAGRKRDGSVDLAAQLEVLTTAEGAIVSIVQEWNIDNSGVPLPISIDSLDELPDPLFNAVSMAVGKALSQGSLDPNLKAS